jgi:hypothetical protein
MVERIIGGQVEGFVGMITPYSCFGIQGDEPIHRNFVCIYESFNNSGMLGFSFPKLPCTI